MTSETTQQRSELPPPGTSLGRRITAFIEFVGPATVAQVAAHFSIPVTMADWSMVELRNIGYLKYVQAVPLQYDSLHRWNPDEPHRKGATSGPDTPERHFREVPR